MKSVQFAQHKITSYDDRRLHLDRTNAVWVEWPLPAIEGGVSGAYFLPDDAAELLLHQCEDYQKPVFRSAAFIRDWLQKADEETRSKWLPVWRKWAEVWRIERDKYV